MKIYKRLILIALVTLQSASPTDGSFEMLAQEIAKAQKPVTVMESHYRIYRADGSAATLADIVKAMADYQAVLLGESHDDPVAHHLEAELLKLAYEGYVAKRPLVLSLEMFERDVQTVLDEYLNGLINEQYFLRSARPWRNYESDYKSMIEFARTHKLPVIAANAPRRYVNLVSRLGQASLNDLSPQAKIWLPPLPYAEATPAYTEKFRQVMRGPHQGDATAANALDESKAKERAVKAIAAQSLWDASMAHSIAEQLKLRKDALVLHVNGRFHSEERMGIPDHLSRYRPQTRRLIVTMMATDTFHEFNREQHAKYGDFIILTDEKLPRTYQVEEVSPRRDKATQ